MLEAGEYNQLAELMNRNFDLRRSMFGDAALGSTNLQMIELARSVGGMYLMLSLVLALPCHHCADPCLWF